MHGGLSKELRDFRQFEALKRPLEVPTEGMIVDLLWGDPCPDNEEYEPGTRGTAFNYGSYVTEKWLSDNGLELVCRGNQVVPIGVAFPFKPRQIALTLFSAPDYCDGGNSAAMMLVDGDLRCTFEFVSRPMKKIKREVRPPTPMPVKG